MTDYAKIFRQLHPKLMPFNPYEKQRELSHLWPADQAKFRQMVDTVRGQDHDNSQSRGYSSVSQRTMDWG